jgi:hypothetical protein
MLPTIDRREVLPVRFIEYYTGNNVGPEGVALLLAGKQGIDWNRGLDKQDEIKAYHRLTDGQLVMMTMKEWKGILFAIQSLSERFDKAERHFSEWLAEALKILPVAFVWRDQFDLVYSRAMSPDAVTFLDCNSNRLTGDSDKEERGTNESPYIPPELHSVVFEGFIVNDGAVAGQSQHETDAEMCERMKREGWPEAVITQKLRQANPGISSYKVGALLPANPGATIAQSSVSKRGQRLLEQAKQLDEAQKPGQR